MQLQLNPDIRYNAPVSYQVLEIVKDAPDEILTANMMEQIPSMMPAIDPTKGVIINGAATIWIYAFLVHQLHSTAWVATHDPRLGAVVVQTHSEQVKVCQVFALIK